MLKAKDSQGGVLFYLFKRFYAPFLLHKLTRPAVIILFTFTLFGSIALVPRVAIGLDQKLALPRDSYVLDYFKSVEKYLYVGAPVYFIVKGIPDYS